MRFSIQTGNSLPVFIPKIDPSARGPINTTIYKISFDYSKTNLAVFPPVTTKYQTTYNAMYTPTAPYVSGPLPYNY